MGRTLEDPNLVFNRCCCLVGGGPPLGSPPLGGAYPLRDGVYALRGGVLSSSPRRGVVSFVFFCVFLGEVSSPLLELYFLLREGLFGLMPDPFRYWALAR